MISYCLKWKNNTESKNPEVVKTKKRKINVLSNCAVYGSKNQNLLKSKKLVDYQVA